MNPITLHRMMASHGDDVIVLRDNIDSNYHTFVVQPTYGLHCSSYQRNLFLEITKAACVSNSGDVFEYHISYERKNGKDCFWGGYQ